MTSQNEEGSTVGAAKPPKTIGLVCSEEIIGRGVEVVNGMSAGFEAVTFPNTDTSRTAPRVSGSENNAPGPLGKHARSNSPSQSGSEADSTTVRHDLGEDRSVDTGVAGPRPLGETQAKARITKYALQSGARELLPDERVASCLRATYTRTVDILYSKRRQRARYTGLVTCGSVWMCPVCAGRISEKRRVELGTALSSWSGSVAHVTLTLCHKHGDDLAGVLDGLLDARQRLKTGKRAAQFNNRFGCVGCVRALEVTHGRNGWHPHLHELLFLDTPDLDGVEQDIRARWGAIVTRLGLRDVNEHGVNVALGDDAAAEYLAKFGKERTWGPEHELAKQVVKKGREGGRTPIDLLGDYTLYADDRAGWLWTGYARAFKGKRQLSWSRGLRDLLLPGRKEQSDEDVAQAVDDDEYILARLNLWQWRLVLANDVRAEVLEIASTGDSSRLLSFLQGIGC